MVAAAGRGTARARHGGAEDARGRSSAGIGNVHPAGFLGGRDAESKALGKYG